MAGVGTGGPPGPGRAPRGPRRRPIEQGRGGQLDVVVLGGAGALDQADRRQRDVDEVELVGERLDDTAEPVEVVADQGLAQVGAQDLGPALAQVGHGRQVGDLELRVGRVLDVAQLAMLARLDERDRGAFAAGPPGPPDPVDVLVRVGRDVVVDDVRDVVDVEAACGDVRRDQDVQRAVAEAAHHPVAAFLGEATMERPASWPRALSASARSSTSPRVRAKTSAEVGSSTSRIRHRAASLSLRRTT